jgi:hypothetical protein
LGDDQPKPAGPMTERMKLRHKVTCEEKGPYWGFLPNTWFKLFATGEYDYIRSSDCYDKHGNEIFEGDMVSYLDGSPIQIVEMIERVGYFEDGEFVDVTPEWSAYAEIVGRNGTLFNW